MAVRKQLKWDDTTDIWPITDASAVHYTYNPLDASKIISPASGNSYGLDNYLNGLLDRFMTKDLIAALANNINKGAGLLYNSTASTTAVAAPSVGTSNAFAKITYTSTEGFTIAFDTTTYLPTTTNYALSSSPGGSALTAVNLVGGEEGNIVYLDTTNDTAFLDNGLSGLVLKCNGNAAPSWMTIENYITSTVEGSYTLTTDSWQDGCTLPTLTGTYAIYIDDSNGSYAGIFAIEGGAAEKLEEIPLHWATAATTTADANRIYAAVQGGKIKLSSNTSGTYSLTIKYKRII